MSIGEDIGAYGGSAAGTALATFLGQPELIPLAANVGSQIGKFVGKKGEKVIVKGAEKFFKSNK